MPPTPTRPRRSWILFLLLAAGCGGSDDAGVASVGIEPLQRPCDDDPEGIAAQVTEALTTLSLEDKVRLMAGEVVPDPMYPVPGLPALGFPGLRMSDGPRGVSARAGVPSTAFPVGANRGATWDPTLEERVGAAMGRELRAAGGDVLLAPTMNLLRHPRWGRAQETYGEDPWHLGSMAVAFVRGVQREGVIASAKHFAVNSIDDTRFVVDVTVDERALREVYLPHFRRVVREAGVGSVMSAYNSVNGAFMSANDPLLRGILKGEWGFEGFVESDWVFGVRDTVGAARGGLDIEMPQAVFFGDALIDAVGTGDVDEDLVDQAVGRVLGTQLCFGLDERPTTRDEDRFPFVDHAALAREVAQRSVVLLRNDGGVVPIDPGTLAEVVVLGDLATVENIGDEGSSAVDPPYVVTVLEGIVDAVGGTAKITHLTAPLDDADRGAISTADLVITVVGLTGENEGEGGIAAGDRTDLELPPGQGALVAAGAEATRSITLVMGSGAMVGDWMDLGAALLWVGYPGQEGGHGISDVLFGAADPTGRLPVTFPELESDLPAFDNVSRDVTYDGFHGYRHLDRMGTPPRFPFGFGLSTTELTVVDARLRGAGSADPDASVVIEADVRNDGPRAGTETVQVYASAPGSSFERPERVLVAFAQRAVAPGATETIELEVPVRGLAVYDPGRSGWVVERRRHVLHIGTNARDLPFGLDLTIR